MSSSTELNLKGNWNIIKGKLKQTYGHLTSDDLAYTDGQDDELIGRLQKKLGQTHQEIHALLHKLSNI